MGSLAGVCVTCSMALSKLPGTVVHELDALGLLAAACLTPVLGDSPLAAKKLRKGRLMAYPCGANELRIYATLSISTDGPDWAIGHLNLVIWT